VGELDRGERDLHDVELVGEGLHDAAEALEVVAEQALPQRGAGELEPAGPQVGDGGHPLDLIGAPVTRSIVLSIRCARGSTSVIATPSRPARPTRPMRCT
jgi:hypothetical protein